MANKERLGLLANESNGRVVLQSWLPRSMLPASTQDKPSSNSNFLEEEKITVPVGIQKPRRKNKTTIAASNPFDIEKPILADHWQIEEKETHAVCPSFETARQQTQATQEQLFSCNNPFTEPGAHVFNNFNDEITSTFMTNPSLSGTRNRSQHISWDPFESKEAATNTSWLDQLNPSSACTKTQSKGHQQFQDDVQDLFDDEWMPARGEKTSSSLFTGDPSHSESCADDKDKSSSNESLQKIIKIKNIKKKKDRTTKKFERKTKKKMQNPRSFIDSSKKKAKSIRPNDVKVSVKKVVNNRSGHRTEALAELLRGTTMLKFPRKMMSFEAHFKFVQLTRSKTTLYLQWFSKRKSLKATTINIADMNCVLQGKNSYVYIRHKEHRLAPCALSIIYNKSKSLDLVAKNINECVMWNKCLSELIKRAKLGKNLTCIQKVWINGLNYVDRNRPKREQKGMIVRANMLIQRNIDARVVKSNNKAVERFWKRVKKLLKLAKSGNVRSTDYHMNLMLSVVAIQDRLEELQVETRESMDSSYSKHDIWRLNVDLECLEEKVKVLRKDKNFFLL